MSIYQHFRPDEKNFIDQVLEWKNYVETSYSPKLTDFLDPREQTILTTILGKTIPYEFHGGYLHSERKRALVYPDYYLVEMNDFDISLFEIHYPRKFHTLKHPQILGSLMSLGLRRGKFGDILICDERVQFFAAKEISDYIRLNLQKVANVPVKAEEIPLDQAIIVPEQWQEMNITVSSLRLDTVLSSCSRMSRQKIQQIIENGGVKVNWKLVEETSYLLREGDVISLRGYGRIKILAIGPQTKKDKWRLVVGKQK